MTNDPHAPICLTLADIAAWQFSALAASGSEPPMIAEIPSLQRGAVWNPSQIELLWDSIMRGFPVGSLVVCNKLGRVQLTRSGDHGEGWPENKITHHLLDGQQRCNAIALGFLDPFDFQKLLPKKRIPRCVLWLDLAQPNGLAGSTRSFLFRVLTIAHPWGYRQTDRAEPLFVGPIRDALAKYGLDPDAKKYKRPPPHKVWPYEAMVPVPFAWMLNAAQTTLNNKDLWDCIRKKCLDHSAFDWASKALKLLESQDNDCHLTQISNGLQIARKFQIAVLTVPKGVLTQAVMQESNDNAVNPPADEHVTNVEQLFQRLNGGGTELRGEELAFSMIKAYWPGVEKSFDALKRKPMADSRLAMLGARAALIDAPDHDAKLPAPLSVSVLRGLAQRRDKKALVRRQRVEEYFGVGRDVRADSYLASDLHKNLELADQWLLYRIEAKADIGLPKVLLAGLAQSAPEVFLLVLHFAQRIRTELNGRPEVVEELRKPILGLVSALHWFGEERGKAVEKLYENRFHKGKLTPKLFEGALRACYELDNGRRGLLNLLTPADLNALIPVPTDDRNALKRWKNMWNWLVESSSGDALSSRKTIEWPFFDCLRSSTDLLLYAQRHWLDRRFDYDPAQRDTWKEYNRPWDYDHILASATVKGSHGRFRLHIQEWIDTIGNLRAWPLEQNRSKRDDLACEAIFEPDFNSSLILDNSELNDFSLSREEIDDPQKAKGFLRAARDRLIRIYTDWYATLDIGRLV